MFKIATKIAEDTPINVQEAKKLFDWLSFNIVNDDNSVIDKNQLTLPIEKAPLTSRVESANSPFVQPNEEIHPGEREFIGDPQC